MCVEKIKRVVSKKVYRDFFNKHSNACIDDDEKFYDEFIEEVKNQCLDTSKRDPRKLVQRIMYKRDESKNTDNLPIIEYFVLAMLILADFFSGHYIHTTFILFLILISMIYRSYISVVDSTKIAFFNLCLRILEDEKSTRSNILKVF